MGTNKTRYSYEIKLRPEHVGGGWRLRLLEDGEEVAGGAFPPGAEGYAEALAEADDWLSTRRWEDHLPPDESIAANSFPIHLFVPDKDMHVVMKRLDEIEQKILSIKRAASDLELDVNLTSKLPQGAVNVG